MNARLTAIMVAVSFAGLSCTQPVGPLDPPVPGTDFFSQTRPLPASAKAGLEGIYTVTQGADHFGPTVVLKWAGNDLSLFTGTQVGYCVLQAGMLDTVLIVQGYWRRLVNDQNGLVQMYIKREEGGRYLLGDTTGGRPVIRLQGAWGDGGETVSHPLILEFLRPIRPELLTAGFEVLAHRGGGRTSDRLPASENSVEMIRIAEQLGATGIEIDVRLSSDGVPILYHDNSINPRLTRKTPLVGGVEDYTFVQLRTAIRLIHGERIPTLKEALETVLNETQLRLVWLDTKTEGRDIVSRVVPIQDSILTRARAIGRNLTVLIGIPTQEVLDEVLRYPGYAQIPTLCELSLADVRNVNARVWAPRWTEGTNNAQVAEMHAEGRRAFVWTLDQPGFISQFIRDGDFDGILTNYSSAVAYSYYGQ